MNVYMHCMFIQEQLTLYTHIHVNISMHDYNLSVYWCIFFVSVTQFLIFFIDYGKHDPF